MKCDFCGHEWVAVSPVEAQELECPQCGKMTPLYQDTAVAYSVIKLQFYHPEDKLPEPGVAVLGAWMGGDEFHIAPSTWYNAIDRWLDWDGEFAYNDYQLYAWAEWPDAPPVSL